MVEVKLLVSASVIYDLYTVKSDFSNVLSEFIKQVISDRSLLAFSSKDCVRYLEEDYGFSIPEEVIEKCIQCNFSISNAISLKYEVYNVENNLNVNEMIKERLTKSKTDIDEIITRICRYCSFNGLLQIQKRDIEKCFAKFLISSDTSDPLTDDIAECLITNEGEQCFMEKIYRIQEGLMLYKCIACAGDLSILSSLECNLAIYLNKENLLNAVGLNGVFYKQILDELIDLINKINLNTKKGKIEIKYFEETKHHIDSLFDEAEAVIETNELIDPAKTAMINICNGCRSRNDLIEKKADFMTKLHNLNIILDKNNEYYGYADFVIKNQSLLKDSLEDLSGKTINLAEVSSVIKLFAKVNINRKTNSNVKIDQAASIFLIDYCVSRQSASSINIDQENYETLFATDIRSLTEALWCDLNITIGCENIRPRLFNPTVVAKVKISNKVINTLSNMYSQLYSNFLKNEIDKDILYRVHQELCKAPALPEDISRNSMFIVHDFMNNRFLDKLITVEKILKMQTDDISSDSDDLFDFIYEAKTKKRAPFKKIARIHYAVLRTVIYIVIPLLLIYTMLILHASLDFILTVIFIILIMLSLLISVTRPSKIDNYIWSLSKRMYKKKIQKLLKRSIRFPRNYM